MCAKFQINTRINSALVLSEINEGGMDFCNLGLSWFGMLVSIFHTFESAFAKIVAHYQQVKHQNS